jgi:hypothetical protein
VESEWLDIVKGSAVSETKEETSKAQPSDDGGTCGPAHTLLGNCSGCVALRREQLKSDHYENQAMGKEGEADHRCHKHSPRERRNGGMSLKEWVMWYVDLLQGNDHEISSCITAITR